MPIGLPGSTEDHPPIGFGGSRRAIEPIATAFVGYGINYKDSLLQQRVEFANTRISLIASEDAILECVALSCLLTDENGWYNYKKKS